MIFLENIIPYKKKYFKFYWLFTYWLKICPSHASESNILYTRAQIFFSFFCTFISFFLYVVCSFWPFKKKINPEIKSMSCGRAYKVLLENKVSLWNVLFVSILNVSLYCAIDNVYIMCHCFHVETWKHWWKLKERKTS